MMLDFDEVDRLFKLIISFMVRERMFGCMYGGCDCLLFTDDWFEQSMLVKKDDGYVSVMLFGVGGEKKFTKIDDFLKYETTPDEEFSEKWKNIDNWEIPKFKRSC